MYVLYFGESRKPRAQQRRFRRAYEKQLSVRKQVENCPQISVHLGEGYTLNMAQITQRTHASGRLMRGVKFNTSNAKLNPICHLLALLGAHHILHVSRIRVNPLNPELNPICYLLALLAHHFLHVSRIRVKSLTLRLLMSYIYIWSTHS